MFNSVGTMAVAFGSGRFWMSVIFICGTCALIDYIVLGFDFIFFQTLGKLLQKLFSQRGPLNDEYHLPKCINDRINMYKTYEQQKVHNENETYKIPQNTKDYPEDSPLDGYVRIENITKDNEANKNINNLNNNKDKIKNEIKDVNNTKDQFLNDYSNSDMNITTHLNLNNNQEEDDMDIFPNYPRPSLITQKKILEDFY
jgi:hypothetical protein